MRFAYLWNSEVGKHSIFFQVLIHIDAVLGPVHCQFVGNVYWCLKVWQDMFLLLIFCWTPLSLWLCYGTLKSVVTCVQVSVY